MNNKKARQLQYKKEKRCGGRQRLTFIKISQNASVGIIYKFSEEDFQHSFSQIGTSNLFFRKYFQNFELISGK